MDLSQKQIAYYHLPGLFEFYELYSVFLPLFRAHREYFLCLVQDRFGLWSPGGLPLGRWTYILRRAGSAGSAGIDAGIWYFCPPDLQQFLAERRTSERSQM